MQEHPSPDNANELWKMESASTDFWDLGGDILDSDEASHRPTRWKCGLDEHGKKIDPPGVEGDIQHGLATDKDDPTKTFWEGKIATAADKEAEADWAI